VHILGYRVKGIDHELKKKIITIPTSTGCYLMKDAAGTIIYIGKAKNIRKRVSSYWHARDIKTYELTKEIADIEYILTNTEAESLILEAQLIVQYHPKYNIDLQTPGRYAFIKISDDEYPLFTIARRLEDTGIFLGPYPSAAARNAALASAYRIFRICKQKSKKGKACFRYHLGKCGGACARIISPEEYRATVKAAEKFLRGDLQEVITDAEKKMKQAADSEEFEKAAIYRDRLLALRKLGEQNVSRPKHYDQDVINGLFGSDEIRLQIFHFNRGIISGRKEYTFDSSTIQRSEPACILADFIMQYYRSHDVPREIILPLFSSDHRALEKSLRIMSGHAVTLVVPSKGIKKKLLDLVRKNLVSAFGERGGQLYELQMALHLQSLPTRIACIDISTLGGTNTVGSLIQFSNGQPLKGGYRRFQIRGVVGINDFAAVQEVVQRYTIRVAKGKEIRPDLLMIDGGKGQLSSARKALASTGVAIPVIALAKRLEEIYLPDTPHPLRLHPRSPALQLLRAIRDEAHRFAITYQRRKRSIYSRSK
ncbi:excinuclease ABC subunit UvrC, partial [Candidatus Uhrbacteria bacterium]|nr:excinuclease ABC subunit UvrC [Candidatus Uhrbacteria bacterium]